MFRSFTLQRSIALRRPIRPAFSRFSSSQSSSSTTSSVSQHHIPITHPKQKLDLRPAPIKLKTSTLSATHTPRKPISRPPTSQSSPSIGKVKETAQRDIEHAETHGILTPPPPDANWFKRILHKAIQLAKFYYAGVKLIFVRRKQVYQIRSRIKAGGRPLSRFENRIIKTQKDDVNKVIPFIFIALLLEEVIPLIAIYAPFMLPSTCILPSQRARIEAKRTDKAIAFSRNFRPLFAQLKLKEGPAGHLSIDILKEDEVSFALCGLLRLSTAGFNALRIRRIKRHVEFLAIDDQLLLQDGLLGQLSEKDLDQALEERGMITQGLAFKTKETRLQWWLDSVGQSSSVTDRLLLLMTRH